MDQGVIAGLKKVYKTSVLRKLFQEENDLKSFLKNFTILDAIYECASVWEKVKKNHLWKKVFPDIDSGEDDFLGFSQEEITVTQLANMAKQVPGGESIDEDENIDEWFQCDKDLPSFEMMSDEEIVRRTTQGQGETESDEEGGRGSVS